MTITAPLIFISIFSLASIALFVVYRYSIKKKTYEEVVAEHRKQTSALLGPPKTPKQKKSKKLARKKASANDPSSTDEKDEKKEEKKEHGPEEKEKVHVEFKEEPEELTVLPEAPRQSIRASKKSILSITKETEKEVQLLPPVPTSEDRFEKIHPRDEIEMRHRSLSRDKGSTKKALKPQVPSEPKEKKKKKLDNNKNQTTERVQLFDALRGAELSRTEVQQLIDLLLDKQLEAPAVINDWSEGKSDPIQKLKKQLAEKEKQLTDAEEALTAVQLKLRQIRAEMQTEKTHRLQEAKTEAAEMQKKLQEAEDRHKLEVQRLLEENMEIKRQLEASLMSYQEGEQQLQKENLCLNNQLQMLKIELQEREQAFHVQIETLERSQAFAIGAQREETRKLSEKFQIAAEQFRIDELNLKDIIEGLQTDLRHLKEAQQLNGSEHSKEYQIEIHNLNNQLATANVEIQRISESDRRHSEELSEAREQLEEQKRKNDDLRQRNWKVMEALKAAENRLSSTPAVDLDKERLDAQNSLIQRLFPNLNNLSEVEDHIRELQKPSSNSSELSKLQSEAQHYKGIIDETEKILTRLESHIEQEERKWQCQLRTKDEEIEELKRQVNAPIKPLQKEDIYQNGSSLSS